MKPQNLHAHEDRLLDFAYGELPAAEARAMESHLQGCTRCTEALDGIRGVRATMSQLASEAAPDAGLESLLAYAQQTARRASEGPVSTPSRWRRWLMPAVGLATVTFIGLVSHEVAKTVDLRPSYSEPKQSAEAKPFEGAKREQVAQQKTLAEAAKDEDGAPADAYAAPTGAVAAAPPAPIEAKEKAVYGPGTDRPVRTYKKDARGPRADWSNSGSGGGFPESSNQYRARDEEGAASIGSVQAIPPTEAAKAELEPAPSTPAANQPRAEPFSEPSVQAQQLAQAPSTPPASKPRAIPQAQMEAPPAQAAAADKELAQVATREEAREERVPESQAPKFAPDRSSLRLGGSSSLRGVGTASSSAGGAMAMTADNMAPPPPPAAAAPIPAPVPVKVPVASASRAPSKVARTESDDALDAALSEKKASRKTAEEAASPAQLSQRALEAQRAGNRALEVRYLREALAAGATGTARLGLLTRLCEAEFALGQRDSALEACGQVLSEDPDSSAAMVARKRMGQESESGAARGKQAAPAKAAPARATDLAQ